MNWGCAWRSAVAGSASISSIAMPSPLAATDQPSAGSSLPEEARSSRRHQRIDPIDLLDQRAMRGQVERGALAEMADPGKGLLGRVGVRKVRPARRQIGFE